MSCYQIYYENGCKMMRPVTTQEEYLTLRGSMRQHSLVDAVRDGDESKKGKLLQMNYSCIPGTDNQLKGCKTPSNTVGMDVDIHRDENEAEGDYQLRLAAIPAKVLAKKEELGLLMLERSVRKGYHLVFGRRFMDGLAEGRVLENQEKNLRWASELLGVEFDKGAKDITRVFFTTTDTKEDLIYLDEELFRAAEPLGPTSGHLPLNGEEGLPTDDQKGDAIIANDPGNNPVLPIKGEMSEGQRGSSDCLYLGIPYARIIKKWWEKYNDGMEPCPGNRNTLTFELAVNLRHICGFDRELLNKVIPNYWATDGNSVSSPNEGDRGELEKLACIDSALNEKRTQMPKRLKDVLMAIRQEQLMYEKMMADGSHTLQLPGEKDQGMGAFGDALDNVLEADSLYHYDRLPKMPQGVSDSIDAAGHPLAMPALVTIAPAIGALATGVKLDVHGKARGLNLCSFIVGEFASGKGQMDDIVASWMQELQSEADIYTQQEDEWAQKTKRMKSGKAPEQPKLPVRMLTLNNTVANIAERLANAEGKHCFSFTPEADNVALKWKQSVSDFSVMLRQAYDEARYDREAKSADAVRVHIPHLLWNVTMCGTQDALYRVITNYTDGLLSRIAIARTPDNTFAPLDDNPAQITARQQENIRQVAHLLPLMTGTVVLPKLEARGRQWVEGIRLEAMKNYDRVLARQRFRGCVNAQRITCALWLPRVAELLIKKHGLNGAEKQMKMNPDLWKEVLVKQQSEQMLQLFDLLADYLIDNDLYFFRERIEQAYEASNYQGNPNSVRRRKSKNDSIFERLSQEFTIDQASVQAMAVKGSGISHNAVQQMLKNWKNQGLIKASADGRYEKI